MSAFQAQLRVLFHCWEYPPHPGGVGRYIRNMSEALAADGHVVVLAVGRDKHAPEYEERAGVLIHRCFHKEESYHNKTAQVILSLVKRYDITLIEGADHLGCTASLFSYPIRPPVVIKCHSCSILHAAHERAHALYPWQKCFIRLARLRGRGQAGAERASIEKADVLTAPSKAIFDEMAAQGLNLPARQEVIPNPIKAAKIFSGKEAERPTLLFIGRLDIGKGIQYLPLILRDVISRFPDLSLEIVGDDSYARGLGSLKEWLKRQFGRYEKHVVWSGYLTEQEVQTALQRTWLVIVPSRWDTFPTVLLETMAHAKAAVVSDKGGIPEMVSGTKIPVCSPEQNVFTQHIIQLLQHPEKRKRVGMTGYHKIVTSFSSKTVV
ncbi:MAG: glycosyltransferase family 1 protein, partial [Candidatus Electrothrix sp. EH2]|nr:glycosyltransferase family 1 protein [Candidatus Electrothrix sp. EH2]